MIIVPVRVSGDCWVNPDEVTAALNTDQFICLDFLSEGPSLHALGIVRALEKAGKSPESVLIINNPNWQEKTPYQNSHTGLSHLFGMSKQYWCQPGLVRDDAVKFGYFMGRRTSSRTRILYDLWQQGDALLSLMHTVTAASHGTVLEQQSNWLDNEMITWFQDCPVVSLDGHSVRDQYVKNPQTNADILKFYDRFKIEIVAESFTLGNTFFPTEKTVRPIMACKPMLVYGARYFLRRLRELGFKTYHTCWDESYDDLEGVERWLIMQRLMPHINVCDAVLAIAEYNRQHLSKISLS